MKSGPAFISPTPREQASGCRRSSTRLFRAAWLLLAPFFLAHCSAGDDQREFESEAYRAPSGYTMTDGSGEVTGKTDADDWRISPFYAGMVEISPAWPNPVPAHDDVRIRIYTALEAVNSIQVYVLHDNGSTLITDEDPMGEQEIRFRAGRLWQYDSIEPVLKRILIMDGNNVISYGDIRVM